MEFEAGDEIDLSEVITAPKLSMSFRYVLVIEWLFDDDEKTGMSLATKLAAKMGEDRVLYVPCRSAKDVLYAIAEAERHAEDFGWPIVHIEAHGEDPETTGATPRGFVGPDGTGGPELLAWQAMGDSLRRLNVASRFNLILVGASCFGEGPILAIEHGKPMPFTAIVGYSGSVNFASLRDAMLELYRRVLSGEELGLAVDAANAEHRYEKDAELRLTSASVLVLEGFIQGISTRIGRESREGAALDIAADWMRQNNYDLSSLPYSRIKIVAPDLARNAFEKLWAELWMTTEYPENAKRFAIDYDAAVRIAKQLDGKTRLRIKLKAR